MRETYYQRNKERILAKQAIYRQEHKEEIKQRSSKWRQEHKPYYQAYKQQWQQENKEHIKDWSKTYYNENKEQINADNTNWRNENLEYARAHDRKRRQDKATILAEYKENIGCLNPKCQWHGEYVACLLHFHHIDPATKTACVKNIHSKKIWEEIAKCTLLCANCHSLVTWNKLDIGNLPACKPPADAN